MSHQLPGDTNHTFRQLSSQLLRLCSAKRERRDRSAAMTTVYAVPVQTDQRAVPVAAGVPVGVKTEWVAVEESSRSIGGAKRIGRYRRPDRVMLISMPVQPPGQSFRGPVG